MIKRLLSEKLAPVWMVLSSVVVVAGIILYALIGFNFSADVPQSYTLEVRYYTVVSVSENADKIYEYCEEALKENGFTSWTKKDYEITGGGVVEYTVVNGAENKLLAAKNAVEAKIAAANADGTFADTDSMVAVHKIELQGFGEARWRGAIAIAVGAIVALGYVAIRFGIANAISGLVSAVHDSLFTLAILVICRIPVYGFMPVTLGAISMLLSVLLWIVISSKMRENFSSPEYAGLSAEDAVANSVKSATKLVFIIVGALAVSFLLLGLLATQGVMAFFLPALVCVAVGTYSSLVFTPVVHTQFKKKFDRIAAKKKRYDYAKKKDSESEND